MMRITIRPSGRSKRKENKMTRNLEKTILRDSGNGQFISKRQAAKKPRNTWQKARVPARNPMRGSRGASAQ
jgi:hypothetical protein